jgi:hypothetical protein
MSKIYIVQSFFEDFDTSISKIIGVFNDQSKANEVAEKWISFYETKKISIFDEPKGWKPSEEDKENLGFENDPDIEVEWIDSIEYSTRVIQYRDILYFKEITIDEFELNHDMSLNDTFINDDLMSLMVQWNRNSKLDKIII